MGKSVGVTREEKALSYYKYFDKEMAPVAEEKLQVLKRGPVDPELLMPFEKKDLFLRGDDEGFCKNGFGVLTDGTGLCCNEIYMPGVTPEMLDWWFPWHSVGSDLRYKLWNPEDHYFARADKVDYVIDPAVPVNQKTWGVTHYIYEDVGPGPELIQMQFMDPATFGFDTSIIGTEKCASLVCAAGLSSFAASMVHKWYPYKDGVMFCSRFWIGYGFKDGTVKRIMPEGVRCPDMMPAALFNHDSKEYTNLASILPSIYSEEKDNW